MAFRLVQSGQTTSSEARSLGGSSQSLDKWVKALALGRLRKNLRKPVDADQMEIARLRAESSKTRVERDI